MRAALLLLVGCVVAGAAAQGQRAEATLSASNEVVPVNSPTTATWEGKLSADNSSMDWTLQVKSATNFTMAHIHQGNATTEGPVIVPLVPVGMAIAAGATSLPMLTPAQSGDVKFSGTFTAKDFTGPLAGKAMKDLLALFQASDAYVNVHDVENPDGVARGQVVLV